MGELTININIKDGDLTQTAPAIPDITSDDNYHPSNGEQFDSPSVQMQTVQPVVVPSANVQSDSQTGLIFSWMFLLIFTIMIASLLLSFNYYSSGPSVVIAMDPLDNIAD